MRRATRTHLPLAAALLAGLLLLPGCDRQSKEQIALLQASIKVLEAKNDALAADETQAAQQAADLKARADAVAAERDDLKARLAAAQEKAQQLEAQAAELKKAAVAPAGPADAGKVLARLEALGADLFQDGDYNAANAVLLSACDLGSKDPLTFYQLAFANASAGRYGDATGWYEKALAALSQQPDAARGLQERCLSNYGVALAQAGKVPEAIASYTKALALDPSYTPPLYNLALLYARKTGEKDKAIDALRQYVARGGSRSISARDLLQELLGPQPATEKPLAP